MKKFKRLAALILASAMIFTGCKDDGTKPIDNETKPEVAMGRYVETQLTVPENMGYFYGLKKLANNSLVILANNDIDKNIGPWFIYSSNDNGKSWNKMNTPWLDALDSGTSVSYVDFLPDGSMFISYTGVPEGAFDPDFVYPEDYLPQYSYIYVNSAGEPFDKEVPPDADAKLKSYVSGVKIAGNGDFIINEYFKITQYDGTTGKLTNTYDFERGIVEEYFTYDNTIAYGLGEEIILADLTTGEELKRLDCSITQSTAKEKDPIFFDGSKTGRRLMTLSDDKQNIYFCDNSGIYRKQIEGSVIEKLIDGELTSLYMPSMSRKNFVACSDGSFSILYTEDSDTKKHILMNYHFDETVPTTPSKQLKVYSLEDNQTVRQAIGLFQRNNPDTQVVYEIGMTGYDAVTVSDAIRALNTQLLNKKGPDVLILDGMPIDSYIEKNVLDDLTAAAEASIKDGTWLKNQAESYKKNDKIYAVPARFSVPVIGIASSAVGNAKDLTSMIDWAKEQASKAPKAVEGENKFGQHEFSNVYNAKSLIKQFYPVSAPAWFAEDGSVKPDELSKFLEDIKKVAIPEYPEIDFDLTHGSLEWANDKSFANIGTIQSNYEIAAAEAAIQKRGNGRLMPLNGQVGNVFIPQTIVGINADSSQKEMAAKFFETIMSEQVQINDFRDGLSINTKAFEKNAQSPYESSNDGMWYSSSTRNDDGSEGDSIELQIVWPSEEYMKALNSEIKALNRPVTVDKVMLGIICDQTEGYFNDTVSLENTVTAVTEKIKLYLAE